MQLLIRIRKILPAFQVTFPKFKTLEKLFSEKLVLEKDRAPEDLYEI